MENNSPKKSSRF